MNKKLIYILTLIILIIGLLAPHSLLGCSTFVIGKGKQILFGRNYDFFTGSGFMLTNPRGLNKTALVLPGMNRLHGFPNTAVSPSTRLAVNSPWKG